MEVKKPVDLKMDATVNEQLKADITEAVKVVNLANETSVLLSCVCEKLGLKSDGLTHAQFVEKFSEIQAKSLEAQKFLADKFMVAPVPEKMRKKRIPKV